MIKKLYKYDLKRMTRSLKWFFVTSIGVAIITRLINLGKDVQAIKILGMVFAGITYSAVANVLINAFTGILIYFNYNFYKDESYLTHTLPVTKKQLIISKYLSALTVILSSFIVIIASLLLVLYDKALFEALKLALSSIIIGFNMSVSGFLIFIGAIIFTQISSIFAMALTAIVKGNSYNQKRGMKGVAWFIAYYFGSMLITIITAVIVFAIGGNIAELGATVMKSSSFITIMLLALILNTVYVVYYLLLCYRLFNKGVNVD